jgi:hypothetical protein
LYGNQIVDISPLVDNASLDSGDTVDITSNLLDCDDAATLADLQTLVDRGVNLDDDCPELALEYRCKCLEAARSFCLTSTVWGVWKKKACSPERVVHHCVASSPMQIGLIHRL